MGVKPPDDDDLFRAEMDADGVKPLKPAARVDHAKPRPKPIPLQHLADEEAVAADSLKDTSGWDDNIETGDLITFLRKGLPNDILRRLKRGHWAIQDALDLHGATTAAARTELARFLAESRHRGLRCVLVVNGKGYRSPGNLPVLRNKVRLSLSQRDEVLAFCDAAPADGGSGAVMILLKGS